MSEQMITTLKQRIVELQQTYVVIQREFELIAMHSKGTDTGYNEMAGYAKEVVHSLEKFYSCLSQENTEMNQDFSNHPESIKEIEVLIDEMAVAATGLQKGNEALIDSILEAGTKQKQTNSNQIKEE